MSAPARRRPGAASAIRLAANVEPVRTGRGGSGPEQAAPKGGVADPRGVSERVGEGRVAVTVPISRRVKLMAQTAVLRTSGYPGGHRSFAALVEVALERELIRLSEEFNDGEPFPENTGGFRTGRPFGS